jgi:ADP-ribose pyrophosphatase
VQDSGGWRRRATRVLFESPWLRLRQDDVTLPAGEEITYTYVDHAGYVVVVPVLDDGRVVMERIHRYPVGRSLLECPSGGLDGQDVQVAAHRELEEETGYRAGRVVPIGGFYGSTGISNERFHVCLATELSADGSIEREATEQIEIELHPLADLRERALRGEIEDAASALALVLAAERWRPPR